MPRRKRQVYDQAQDEGGRISLNVSPADGDTSSVQGGNSMHYVLIATTIPLGLQVVILCVLVLVLTYYYTKAHSCVTNREIWCKDDWYCAKQTSSTDKTYSKCYQKKDHLASCLFGPKSDAAVACIDYTKKGLACPCVVPAGDDAKRGSSCLAGCPTTIGKASGKSVCCCVPNTKGCPNKTLPPECTG